MSLKNLKLEEIPNIDLNNFEDPGFVGSRYVLTSPRSLEACANMNIKPVDLLPKSKEEFQREHRNFGTKKIETLFAYFEKERRDKLWEVRLERLRLIKQEQPKNAVLCQQCPARSNELSFDRPNSQPIKRNFSPRHYSNILNKLCPKDVKRIKLAEERYRMSCPQTRISTPNQRLILTGRQSRPHSSAARFAVGRKTSLPNAPEGDSPNKCASKPKDRASPILRRDNLTQQYGSNCSLVKESDYWVRRQAHESFHKEEIDRLKQSLEEKDKKTETNRDEQFKERQRQLVNLHTERERKLRQAQERRKELEQMLESYRRELQETRDQTQQKARERALYRQSLEKQRLIEEHRQREQQAKENYKQVQQREEEWRKMAESIQKQKQENIQRFLEDREARIQESRNLALQAERLREDMLRAYNLDSFDKKVQRVALINELGLGGTN